MLQTGQHAVFSSGGQRNDEVQFGGIALLGINGHLALHFKRKDGRRKWKTKSVEDVLGNTWMHVAGTWVLDGAVQLYIDWRSEWKRVRECLQPCRLIATEHNGHWEVQLWQ